MVRAGLTKLNIQAKPAANSVRAMASRGVAQTTGFGITAQRRNQSIFNPKAYYSGSISATRHMLNDNRVVVNNNFGGKAQNIQQPAGMSSFEKLMMLNMLMQGVGGIAGQVKSTVDAFSSDNTNTNSATSLKELNKQAENIGKDIAKLNDGYKTLVDSNVEKINKLCASYSNSENTFIKNNISKVTPADSLKTQELNLTADSGISDISTAIGTIDKDIQEVDAYIKGLPTEDVINSERTNLTKGIAGLEAQIAKATEQSSPTLSELQAEKEKLKQQLIELNQFEKDVATAKAEAGKIKEQLAAQKNELADLKNKKESTMNKIYAQAQKDDKAIGDNIKKMEALKIKIRKENNQDKKDKLIKEYNGYADAISSLRDAITVAGGTNIKNAGGTAINLTNYNRSADWTAHYIENSGQAHTQTAPATNISQVKQPDGQGDATSTGSPQQPSGGALSPGMVGFGNNLGELGMQVNQSFSINGFTITRVQNGYQVHKQDGNGQEKTYNNIMDVMKAIYQAPSGNA